MNLNDLQNISDHFKNTQRMPVLFLGHGSPMNAIEENQFVQGFRKAAAEIPRPNAILCISAHWFTNGTKVTAMDMPRTIHDFGGFPQALFGVRVHAVVDLPFSRSVPVFAAAHNRVTAQRALCERSGYGELNEEG